MEGGKVVYIGHNHGEPQGKEGMPGTLRMTNQRGRRRRCEEFSEVSGQGQQHRSLKPRWAWVEVKQSKTLNAQDSPKLRHEGKGRRRIGL